jgi:hypothetical protein
MKQTNLLIWFGNLSKFNLGSAPLKNITKRCITGSPEFGHLSLAARHLLGDLTSAVTEIKDSSKEPTKQHFAWTRWTKWLDTVELFDACLSKPSASSDTSPRCLRCCHTIRSIFKRSYCQLAAGTVSDTVNHVASAFIPASPTLASTEMAPIRDFYSASTSATET